MNIKRKKYLKNYRENHREVLDEYGQLPLGLRPRGLYGDVQR